MDILEFVAAKFKLNLTLVQHFSSLYQLKIRIYLAYIMYLVQREKRVYIKTQQICMKNKLAIEEINYQ